jgi:molybdate transport system ATP-binding protein
MTLRANVGLRLGRFELDAAVEVANGEIVAVLGPNGAGKTTLLRAIAGFAALDRGAVVAGDRVLEDVTANVFVAPNARRIGFVFQDYLLFPRLSARENVAFGLRAAGMAATDARSRADAWLKRVGMSHRGDAKPAELSGGEQQRVALARALAIEPALLALDEPLAAVDSEARNTLRHDLRTYLAQFEGPALLVTHDPLEAVTLAHRLVVLEDGKVTQTGTVEEVTRRPRSAWVARFVGVNLYRGSADGTLVTVDGVTLTAGTPAKGPVYVLIRPQAVALYRVLPEGSPRNVWRGSVRNIEAFGDQVRVTVEGSLTVVADVTPAAVAALRLAERGQVWASVKAVEIELYPV